jgi:hypothetical protein
MRRPRMVTMASPAPSDTVAMVTRPDGQRALALDLAESRGEGQSDVNGLTIHRARNRPHGSSTIRRL